MVSSTTMKIFAVLLVCIFFLSLIVGVLARHRHRSHKAAGFNNRIRGGNTVDAAQEEAFNKHVARVGDFRCKNPTPRALSLSSLQDELLWRPAVYEVHYPSETILHRCGDASGCCQNEFQSCQGVSYEEVKLVFKVLDRRNGRTRFEEVNATNHTECSCQEKSNQPK